MEGVLDSAALSGRLLAWTVEQVRLAEASYLRAFHLPCHYGGHAVGPDTRADVAFTLGLLWDNGLREIAGLPLVEALRRVLFAIDGPATHTFYAYRVAETLARFGPLTSNELLREASDAQIDNLVAACDPGGAAAQVRAGRLPRNHAAVLARCEAARHRLGIPHDGVLLEEMLERTRQMLAERPGHLDDSPVRQGRYDLYSADTYLFCEPISALVGPVWDEGARAMLDWVRRVASEDGCAMAWGRSTGALGVCHTIELGALALQRRLTDVPSIWLALAVNAGERLEGWFSRGVTTAHQHRSSDPYRGPRRRLQLTFDILGKVAGAARQLRAAALVEAAPSSDAFPERDELIWFDRERRACVWSYRSQELSFTLPITGCTTSDYLPAPRSPGVFEGQVGSDQPVAVPFLFGEAGRHVGAGLPAAVAKSPRGLELTFEGWPVAADHDGERARPSLSGRRVVRFGVQGSTFRAEERLDFEAPRAVGLQIAETKGRPLHVAFDCASPSAVSVVDTAGVGEWRSFWAELPVVHQLAIDPVASVAFSWSMAPKIRVAIFPSSIGHPYHRAIYGTLQREVVEYALPRLLPGSDPALRALVTQFDVLHLHWPEWSPGLDPSGHRRLARALAEARVPVLWTMHNLEPHSKDPRGAEVYRIWAEAASAVAHHSRWGLAQARARYPFGRHALHAVVPHPCFGVPAAGRAADRERIERELGLRSGVLRLGIVGAPRREKRIDVVVSALASCRRSDLELLILSLGPDEPIPPDPRIRALRYAFVPRADYDRRLAALDALILPFEETGMLTTGTVGDVVGHGLPALVSEWPFAKEILGEAAICYGSTVQQLRDCLETLTPARLAQAAAHSRELRAAYDPAAVGQRLLGLLRSVAGGARKVRFG